MGFQDWRNDALRHCLWLHKRAGRDYALAHAWEWEAKSDGALTNLTKRVEEEISKREAAVLAKEAADAAR